MATIGRGIYRSRTICPLPRFIAMRWVVYFYFLLPRAARPIYLLLWVGIIAALVSDGAGQ